MEITLRIECPALTELNSILRDVIGVAAGGALPGMDAPAQALAASKALPAAAGELQAMVERTAAELAARAEQPAPRAEEPARTSEDNDGAANASEAKTEGESSAASSEAAPAVRAASDAQAGFAPKTAKTVPTETPAPSAAAKAPETAEDNDGAADKPMTKAEFIRAINEALKAHGLDSQPEIRAAVGARCNAKFGVSGPSKISPSDFRAYLECLKGVLAESEDRTHA